MIVYLKRVQYYSAHSYTGQLKAGVKHKDLLLIIVISLITNEWLHMFKCAEKEENPPANIKSSRVLEAYNTIELHNLTTEEYDLYVRTRLDEEAEETALEESFDKGVVKGKVEIAKEMLSEGYPVEAINKLTKLPKEQIEKFKEDL